MFCIILTGGADARGQGKRGTTLRMVAAFTRASTPIASPRRPFFFTPLCHPLCYSPLLSSLLWSELSVLSRCLLVWFSLAPYWFSLAPYCLSLVPYSAHFGPSAPNTTRQSLPPTSNRRVPNQTTTTAAGPAAVAQLEWVAAAVSRCTCFVKGRFFPSHAQCKSRGWCCGCVKVGVAW